MAVSKYNPKVFEKIMEEIATTHKSMRTICDETGVNIRSFFRWLDKDESLGQQYARAKDCQADLLAEETLEIAEHTNEDHTPFTGLNVVQRDRLRIDTRKWLASKLKPKKYGDKVDVTTDGKAIQGTIIQWGDKQIEI